MADLPRKGNVPLTLIKVKTSILVAREVRGSTPNCNMAGTVIREVLPVTTLMMLVRKKTLMRMSNWIIVKRAE